VRVSSVHSRTNPIENRAKVMRKLWLKFAAHNCAADGYQRQLIRIHHAEEEGTAIDWYAF